MYKKYYDWLRHPKTTQEIRSNGKRNIIQQDEYSIKIRNRYLPTVNCDQFTSHAGKEHISWKKLRKTRYKNIKNV